MKISIHHTCDDFNSYRAARVKSLFNAERVDGGDILLQEPAFVLPGESAADLWRRSLFPLGVEMLSRAVAMIAGGNVPRIPQDERFATWEPQYAATRLYRPELLRLT